MMRLPKLEKLPLWHVDAIGIAAALMLSAAAYFLVVQPSLDRKSDREARAAELAAEAAKRRELDTSLKSSADNLKSVLTFIQSNKVNLEPTTATNAHLARLTDLAGECGLQIDAVEPGKEEAGPHYTTVPIRLSGRATAKEFTAFRKRLREQQPDHGVSDLSLAAQPSTTETPASFSLTLLWYASPKNAVALPLP